MNSWVAAICGLPGAGKTSVGRAVARDLSAAYFSTGALLRSNAKYDPELAQALASGRLAPESHVLSAVSAQLLKRERAILLDGFPRHVAQCDFLDNLIPDWHCVLLDVAEEVARERAQQRSVCVSCEYPYVAESGEKMPSCVMCGAVERASRHEDYDPRALAERYRVAIPTVSYFRSRANAILVDASRPFAIVVSEVVSVLRASGHID